jgi:hypothetical protein
LLVTVALKKLASRELDTDHWGVRTTRPNVKRFFRCPQSR